MLPVGGEYWLEGSNHLSNIVSGNLRPVVPNFDSRTCKIEANDVIQSYRRDFMGKVY